MSRHCACDDTLSCRLCWLYHNDPKYRAKWEDATPQPVPPLIVTATSTKAVVVLAVGSKGRELLDITGDGLKAYAARIGADFHAITGEPNQPNFPLEDKFRVGQFLDFYERVLYLDADVVVSEDAPNLFDLVPEDRLGITNEWLFGTWDHFKDIEAIQKANGFTVQKPGAYYNTGLMVLSQPHRAVVAKAGVPYRIYHCAEQDLINARLAEYGTQLHEFGPDLVWLYFTDTQGKRKEGRPFLHYAGASTVKGSRGHVAEMTNADPFAPTLTPEEKAKLLELLRRVDQALGSSYVLAYGALLGYVRHKDLLPWDDDIDVLALNPPTAEELQERLPDLKVIKDKHNILKVFDPTDPKCPGKAHSFPFLDIAPAHLEDGKVTHYCTNGLTDRFPLDVVFPSTRATIAGVEVNIPASPEAFLLQKYGPECLTTAKPSDWSHRNERRTNNPPTRRPLSEVLPQPKPTAVDRWYVLNLARRPDRLKEVSDQLHREGIEFTRMQGVDGRIMPLPKTEKSGSGAYGCRLGHLRILEAAITDKLNVVGVLEDDVVLEEGFTDRLQKALKDVPDDWELLYCGTQHRKTPTPVGPGIVRCVDCHRTHAYIVRGPAIRKLYQIWSNASGHVDHILGKHFKNLKAYAIAPPIAGQGASKSDISGRQDGERWWTGGKRLMSTTTPEKGCGGCKAAKNKKMIEAMKAGKK